MISTFSLSVKDEKKQISDMKALRSAPSWKNFWIREIFILFPSNKNSRVIGKQRRNWQIFHKMLLPYTVGFLGFENTKRHFTINTLHTNLL